MGGQRQVAWTLIGLAGFSVLLSLLPLPDGARPFPTLRKDPKHAVLAALWPRAVAPAPPKALAVLEDAERDGLIDPFEGQDGGFSRIPPPLTPRELSQRKAWDKALDQLQAPGSPVVDPCLEWTKNGCARTGLEGFFDSLDDVRKGKRQVSRIVVFGTSLIASDHITDVARQVLQRAHGNAGPGLLYVDRPTRNSGRTVRNGQATEDWNIEKLTDEKPRDDLGLTGVAFTSAAEKPQSVKYDATGQSVAQVYALAEPQAGNLSLLVDGKSVAELNVASATKEPLYFRYDLGGRAKKLELISHGRVRVDAVSLESAQPGVVLDSLGLPGSSARVLLRANEAIFKSQLKHRDPTLVVVMMGGNEAYEISEGRTGDQAAKLTLEQLLDRVRKMLPSASCLLASPPDAGVFKLDRTISFREQTRVVAKMMREVATAKGCGYYDMQAAMGGEGAVARWYAAKLMNEDLVHPLGVGGDLIGWQFASALEQARLRRKPPASGGKKVQPQRAGVLRPTVLLGAEGDAVDAGTRRRRGPLPEGSGPARGGLGSSDGGESLLPDGGTRRRRREATDGGERPALLSDGGTRRRAAVEPTDGGEALVLLPDGGTRRRRRAVEGADGGEPVTLLSDGGTRRRRAVVEPPDAGEGFVFLADGGTRRRRRSTEVVDAGEPVVLLPDGGTRRRKHAAEVVDAGAIPPERPDAGVRPRSVEAEPVDAGDGLIFLPDGGVRRRRASAGGTLTDAAAVYIRQPDGGMRRKVLAIDAGQPLPDGLAPHLAQHPGLENAQVLGPFFEKLRALERDKQGRVAIEQLGASHTAAHFFTDEARSIMTTRFGYAGRGYIAAGKPSNRLEAAGVSRELTGRWDVKDAVKVRTANQPWGLTGTRAIGSTGASVTVTFEEPKPLKDDLSRIQVFLLETPDGGRGEVLIDGTLAATHDPPDSGYGRVSILDFSAPGAPHAVTVRNAGPGKLGVLGISHELVQPGVIWDSLGLPGATVVTLSKFEPTSLETQLRARQPNLFVLFYGTNEAARPLKFIEKVRAAWPPVLATLKRSAPDSACVLMGPTDRLQKKGTKWVPVPATAEVYAVLRAVAKEHGCAVWSSFDAMGGEGSMNAWRGFKPSWANKDHVHLTHEGYRALAGAFVGDLLSAYDTWKATR